MSTITTIQASDLITNSRADINTNFSNLNTDKIETSTLDTDTTLAANSDSKIATQKAVKAYVDSGGNSNASTTQKGLVEQATDAEVLAQTQTGATGAPLFINPSSLPSLFTAPTIRPYTTAVAFRDTTTRFDITNPSGTTFRYTFDGTGTDPGITSSNPATGAVVNIQGQNFNAANKGFFLVTSSGTNYFEITNGSGVAENDKTLGTGYIQIGTTWTKPTGLKYIILEMVGAGGGGTGINSGGGGAGGGGAGAYLRKKILASALSATEYVIPGSKGAGGINSGTYDATDGMSSYFTSSIYAGGGAQASDKQGGDGSSTTAGSPDFAVIGGDGNYGMETGASPNSWGGFGGCSYFGGGGRGSRGNGTGNAGKAYGSGGGGAGSDGGGGNTAGSAGADGIVIVTEYYV